MKKIVHLLSTGGYSGAEKIVLEIIENDLENKHIYLAPKGRIEKILIERNIDYYLYKDINDLRKFVKGSDVNILHCHDYKASIISGILKADYKISHIHHNPIFATKLNFKSIVYLISVLTYIDKVIYVSRVAKNEYIFNKIINSKSCIISNWINKKERLCSKKYKRNIDILFVGRLVEAKNPELFLQLSKIAKDKKNDLNIVMIGDGELMNFTLDKIKSLGLEDNIKVLGYESNPQDYMRQAKVFLNTSAWEGFGLVVLEAMLNGSVVVTTKVGGLKEIVIDEYNGFFIQDKNSAVEKIIDIIDNFNKYKNIRDNGISSLERFDLNKNTSEIYKVYKNI